MFKNVQNKGPKSDISKRRFKTILSLNLGFRLVFEMSYFDSKKIMDNFLHKGGSQPKKTRNFLCYRGMTIHTPIENPGLVDKKYVVFKNVNIDFWPKKALKTG